LTPSSVIGVEATDKTARSADHASSEWLLVYCTAALALTTIALALYTAKLYRATVGLGAEAKATGIAQSSRMERSITEANRAATAMEEVARATHNNAELMQGLFQKQMRAYLSVEFGTATYQDANWRFEAQPVITNNGLTPARNVSFKILADIVDGRAVNDVKFADIGELIVNDAGLAPRQQFTIRRVVNDRVPDGEVEAIMQGLERRLFAWGKVMYDDVYGGSWETNFCLNYTFYKVGEGDVRVSGFYFPKHNNAT
jgi:hypothetical protein